MYTALEERPNYRDGKQMVRRQTLGVGAESDRKEEAGDYFWRR